MHRSRIALVVATASLLAAVAAPAADPVTRAAGAGAGAAAKPTVRVTPLSVQRGHAITVTGRHWPRNVSVQLLIGPPRSGADPVATAHAGSRGSFRRKLTIAAGTRPGSWVLLACRRDCRVKATATFRVTDN